MPRETVTALHRPPVRRSTTVRSGIDHTFTVFVRDLGLIRAWDEVLAP